MGEDTASCSDTYPAWKVRHNALAGTALGFLYGLAYVVTAACCHAQAAHLDTAFAACMAAVSLSLARGALLRHQGLVRNSARLFCGVCSLWYFLGLVLAVASSNRIFRFLPSFLLFFLSNIR